MVTMWDVIHAVPLSLSRWEAGLAGQSRALQSSTGGRIEQPVNETRCSSR
jgi:hypothetical protein